MERNYRIDVTWARDENIRSSTYERSGELPHLLAEVYNDSIDDDNAIPDPDRIMIRVAVER
jgi:hypothetical protein